MSAAHLATLAALRPAIYLLFDATCVPDRSWAQIVNEYRKDLLTILTLIGTGVGVNEWARAASAPEPVSRPEAPPFRFEVRDGARTPWLAPSEI